MREAKYIFLRKVKQSNRVLSILLYCTQGDDGELRSFKRIKKKFCKVFKQLKFKTWDELVIKRFMKTAQIVSSLFYRIHCLGNNCIGIPTTDRMRFYSHLIN